MNDPQTHRDELSDLLGKLRDGELTDADAAALERMILADPAAMDRYLHHRWIDAGLTERFGERTAPVLDTTPKPVRTASAGRTHKFEIPNSAVYAAAALVAIATVIVGLYVYFFSLPQSEIRDPRSQPPVATLIESTDTRVIYDGGIAHEGDEYAPGAYAIDSGFAQLMLRNRVTVDLRGRTAFSIRSPMRVGVNAGLASFVCPPGTEGFTVVAPGGVRVVDLGTGFTVGVDDDGRVEVYVLDGSVRVERDGAPDQRLVAPAAIAVTERGVTPFDPIDGSFADRLMLADLRDTVHDPPVAPAWTLAACSHASAHHPDAVVTPMRWYADAIAPAWYLPGTPLDVITTPTARATDVRAVAAGAPGVLMHPNHKPASTFAMARWTSTIDGAVRLVARVTKDPEQQLGDGVDFAIHHNGRPLIERTLDPRGDEPISVDRWINVEIGDTIELALGPRGTASHDNTLIDARIMRAPGARTQHIDPPTSHTPTPHGTPETIETEDR